MVAVYDRGTFTTTGTSETLTGVKCSVTVGDVDGENFNSNSILFQMKLGGYGDWQTLETITASDNFTTQDFVGGAQFRLSAGAVTDVNYVLAVE